MAMRSIDGMLNAGVSEFSIWNKLINSVSSPMCLQLQDLRSAVVKQACITISHLACEMKDEFGNFFSAVIDDLINLTTITKEVMAESGALATRIGISECCNPKLINYFKIKYQSKNHIHRQRVSEYVKQLLIEWDPESFSRELYIIKEIIPKMLTDSKSETRVHGRGAFWAFAQSFGSEATKLFKEFDGTLQKNLMSENNADPELVSIEGGGGTPQKPKHVKRTPKPKVFRTPQTKTRTRSNRRPPQTEPPKPVQIKQNSAIENALLDAKSEELLIKQQGMDSIYDLLEELENVDQINSVIKMSFKASKDLNVSITMSGLGIISQLIDRKRIVFESHIPTALNILITNMTTEGRGREVQEGSWQLIKLIKESYRNFPSYLSSILSSISSEAQKIALELLYQTGKETPIRDTSTMKSILTNTFLITKSEDESIVEKAQYVLAAIYLKSQREFLNVCKRLKNCNDIKRAVDKVIPGQIEINEEDEAPTIEEEAVKEDVIQVESTSSVKRDSSRGSSRLKHTSKTPRVRPKRNSSATKQQEVSKTPRISLRKLNPRQSSGLKPSTTRNPSPGTKSSLPVKSNSPNSRSTSPGTKTSTGGKSSLPGVRKRVIRTPRKTSPNTRNTSPNTRKTSPNTRKVSPNTRNTSPNTRNTSPNTRKTSPNTRKVSPNTRNISPNTRKVSPNTRNTSPNNTRKVSPNTIPQKSPIVDEIEEPEKIPEISVLENVQTEEEGENIKEEENPPNLEEENSLQEKYENQDGLMRVDSMDLTSEDIDPVQKELQLLIVSVLDSLLDAEKRDLALQTLYEMSVDNVDQVWELMFLDVISVLLSFMTDEDITVRGDCTELIQIMAENQSRFFNEQSISIVKLVIETFKGAKKQILSTSTPQIQFICKKLDQTIAFEEASKYMKLEDTSSLQICFMILSELIKNVSKEKLKEIIPSMIEPSKEYLGSRNIDLKRNITKVLVELYAGIGEEFEEEILIPNFDERQIKLIKIYYSRR